MLNSIQIEIKKYELKNIKVQVKYHWTQSQLNQLQYEKFLQQNCQKKILYMFAKCLYKQLML